MEKHAYENCKDSAPITGKNPPKYQDTIEMRRQAQDAAPFFDRNDIKTSKMNLLPL